MRAKRADRIATVVFWIIGLVSISILLFITGVILWNGLGKAIQPSFIFGRPKGFKAGGGIWPMIVSSFYITGLALFVIMPISILSAIYLAEYAKDGRFTRFVKFCVDSLASMPSIVFGLFGMTVFVILFGWGYSLIAGSLTVALLNLPTVMRSAEESLRSVPVTYREASLSLGASRWKTIRKVVLPSATPGILTGTMLTVGRILGESAALVYTAGLVSRHVPDSLFDSAAPLAGYIWYVQTEAGAPDYRAIVDGSAALLLVMVLVINFGARRIGNYYQKRTLAGEKRV
ncbi:MAG: phosphate ABC transporter permease PstA [Actinobacteria bacterium]|nr:phosphate ABC transporter permease PstA [Actinomycetota bacterium]